MLPTSAGEGARGDEERAGYNRSAIVNDSKGLVLLTTAHEAQSTATHGRLL